MVWSVYRAVSTMKYAERRVPTVQSEFRIAHADVARCSTIIHQTATTPATIQPPFARTMLPKQHLSSKHNRLVRRGVVFTGGQRSASQ